MNERKRQKSLKRRQQKLKKKVQREKVDRTRSQKRVCGGCWVCCYVYPISELGKKDHESCKFISASGCSIHDQPRPLACSRFLCLWLLYPEIPDRYRPDRIGCVASYRSHDVVHVWQEFRHAAYRRDADQFIRWLTQSGYAVLIVEDDGETNRNRLRYCRRFFPTPPTMADLCPRPRRADAAPLLERSSQGVEGHLDGVPATTSQGHQA